MKIIPTWGQGYSLSAFRCGGGLKRIETLGLELAGAVISSVLDGEGVMNPQGCGTSKLL